MSRRLFHELVHPSEVLDIISNYVALQPLGKEVVALEDSVGRVLAEDVVAGWDSPPFDRSEVDGYAVASASVVGAEEDSPVRLKVIGSVRIGESPSIEVGLGEAVEIDTGAVLPRGADAVVMVEYTKRVGNEVLVFRPVASGENVARAGSDILKGEVVLRAGTLLGPGEVASLATVGVRSVKVFSRPKVAIFSVGNELVEPGHPPSVAGIFDVNSYAVAAALKELGAEPVIKGILPDDESVIAEEFSRALREADVLIASGGTSAGVGDLTYRVLDSLGEPGVIVHGLKMKPGKPTVVAVVNGKLAFGLPGFPLSALMAFRSVVAPVIARLSGLGEEALRPWRMRAKLSVRVTGARGKVTMVPVALIKRGSELRAFPVRTHSGSVHVLTYADGFVRIPEEGWVIEEGEEVEVELFRRDWRPPDLVVIGSHDYLMEALAYRAGAPGSVKLINVGSTRGLLAVGKGEADVAGTHLLDAESGEYNLPYLKLLGIEEKVYLVRGWGREIGFVVQKGNPKGIKSFSDLLRPDVMFINRNKGSGTRTFIDLNLKKLSVNEGVSFEELTAKIKGYWNEVKTHTGIAAAVAQGRADVGVAIRHAAELYGLGFIKLADEIYDIVISKDSINTHHVKELIETLRSEKIEQLMRRFTGYLKLPGTGKVIHEPKA